MASEGTHRSTLRVARHMHRFESEGFEAVLSKVADRRARGLDVVPLHAGELDFDTPQPIIDAAKSALDAGQTRYTPASGTPELRAAIAEHVSATRGVPVEAHNVLVAPGAKPVVFMAMQATLEPGDEVVYLSPAYPIYKSLIQFLGAVPVPVSTDPTQSQGLDIAALERAITKRTRMIVLNSPSNPTGQVLDRAALGAIARIAQEHDLLVLADEIYSHIVYSGAFHSILGIEGMAERTVLVDGFSKTYCMTGWRLGYGIVPTPLVGPLATLMTNVLSCNVSFTQDAAAAALRLDPAITSHMVDVLSRRRTLMVEGLRSVPGVRCGMPDGAFYALADVRTLGRSSVRIAHELLDTYGVASYPGSAFGPELEGYVRFSFGASEGAIAAGIDAVERLVGTASSTVA